MSSKLMRKISVIGLGCLFLFSSGCSYFFNLNQREFKISYKSESGLCTKSANDSIKKYFDRVNLPSVTAYDLDQVYDCYYKSIESFVRYTKSGRLDSESYSAENINLFLNRFYPDIKISLEDIRYYLSIKSFLIGGQSDSLSKSELLKIGDFFSRFTESLKTLLPYRSVYFRKANLTKNEKGYDYYNNAFKVLKDELDKLLKNFPDQGSNSTMDIRSAIQFIERGNNNSKNLNYFSDLIIAFKNLFALGEGDLIQRKNFGFFVRQSFFAYREIMRFHYFIKDNQLFDNFGGVVVFLIKIPSQLKYADTFRGIVPKTLSDIMETSVKMILESMKARPEGQISYDRLHEFLVALEGVGALRKELNSENISDFIQKLLRKWLIPDPGQTTFLTVSKALYLKKIYHSWIQRQKIINTFFSDKNIKSISLRRVEGQMKENPQLKEWIHLFKNVSTHQWRDNGLMFISKKINDISYTEMTISNSIFLLTEFFLKPYNLSVSAPFHFRLTKDQTQEVYEILRILAVPLGIMDSRLMESGYRIFGEGNNFSTQLRNDQFFDFFESYEYLSFALSSFNLAEKTYQNIDPECRLDYVDVHGNLVLEPDCFLGYLKDNFHEIVDHLDIVKRFWQEADEEQRKDIFHALESITKEGFTILKAPYQSGELRVMSIFLYYIESIFFNFDYNRDLGLNGVDLINGENHFESFLDQMIFEQMQKVDPESFSGKFFRYFCGVERDQFKEMVECLKSEFFIYFLTEGHYPQKDFWSKLDFLGTIMFYDSDEIFYENTVTVGDIFGFFALLNKQLYENYKNEVIDFLLKNRSALVSELHEDKDPFECINGDKDSTFCQWSRTIRCNKVIEPYFYQWMNENKYSIFPERIWEEAPEEALVETMEFLSNSFVLHKKFSVHCHFPQYKKEK